MKRELTLMLSLLSLLWALPLLRSIYFFVLTLRPVLIKPTDLEVVQNEYALYLLIAYAIAFTVGFTLSIMCYFKPHKSVFSFFCALLIVPVLLNCLRLENLETFQMGLDPGMMMSMAVLLMVFFSGFYCYYMTIKKENLSLS